VYFRLKRNPSHTFVDPLLRHLLHPSWGFVPMGAAVLLSLVCRSAGSRYASNTNDGLRERIAPSVMN
jgi:hypothetical protein